jgi:hypothetical protein
MFLAFSLVIEGTSKKGVAIFDANGTNLLQNNHSNKQNVNYGHCHKV